MKDVSYFDGGTLAFDLGKSCTGWALMNHSRLIAHGRMSFVGRDEVEMFHGLASLVDGLYVKAVSEFGLRPKVIAVEAAEHQRGEAREAYCALYISLRVKARAHLAGVAKVYSATIKKVVTGSGRASKADVVASVNQVYQTGLSSQEKSADHNVADAIGAGLAAWTLDQMGELTFV